MEKVLTIIGRFKAEQRLIKAMFSLIRYEIRKQEALTEDYGVFISENTREYHDISLFSPNGNTFRASFFN